MATITVTASDPMGESAMQTIMVTVMTPNMAPMAGDDVADQMVYVGAMVEVQSNFSDPDEDMLSLHGRCLATDRHRHGGRHAVTYRRRGRHGNHGPT